MAITLLISALLGLVGFALLLFSRRRPKASGGSGGGAPQCRKCAFDLAGLWDRPDPVSRCPECGRSLWKWNAVVYGAPARRRWMVVSAVTLMSLSLATCVTLFVLEAKRFNWRAYSPISWLADDMRKGDVLALRECRRRLDSGLLSGKGLRETALAAISLQTDPANPWDTELGDFVEAAWKAAQIDRPTLETYLDAAFSSPGGAYLGATLLRLPSTSDFIAEHTLISLEVEGVRLPPEGPAVQAIQEPQKHANLYAEATSLVRMSSWAPLDDEPCTIRTAWRTIVHDPAATGRPNAPWIERFSEFESVSHSIGAGSQFFFAGGASLTFHDPELEQRIRNSITSAYVIATIRPGGEPDDPLRQYTLVLKVDRPLVSLVYDAKCAANGALPFLRSPLIVKKGETGEFTLEIAKLYEKDVKSFEITLTPNRSATSEPLISGATIDLGPVPIINEGSPDEARKADRP